LSSLWYEWVKRGVSDLLPLAEKWFVVEIGERAVEQRNDSSMPFTSGWPIRGIGVINKIRSDGLVDYIQVLVMYVIY
jgi:hypothetical protein